MILQYSFPIGVICLAMPRYFSTPIGERQTSYRILTNFFCVVYEFRVEYSRIVLYRFLKPMHVTEALVAKGRF